MKSTIFQRYFLPGFVYQSAIVAGGYTDKGRTMPDVLRPAIAVYLVPLFTVGLWKIARIAESRG